MKAGTTYLGQAQMNRGCFRYVHDFAIGCYHKNKAVQGLEEKKCPGQR